MVVENRNMGILLIAIALITTGIVLEHVEIVRVEEVYTEWTPAVITGKGTAWEYNLRELSRTQVYYIETNVTAFYVDPDTYYMYEVGDEIYFKTSVGKVIHGEGSVG